MMFTLKFDNGSDLTARLSTSQSDKNVNLSLTEIRSYAQVEAKALKALQRGLVGDVNETESMPVMAVYKGGKNTGVYYPKVCKKFFEDKAVIGLAWGSDFIPLEFNKNSNKLKSKDPLIEIEVELITTNFGGYDKSTCLCFNVVIKQGESDDDWTVLSLIFGVRWADPKSLKDLELSTSWLKHKLPMFVALLDEPQKPILPSYYLDQLPIGEYTVKSYAVMTSKKGNEFATLTVSSESLMIFEREKLEGEPTFETQGDFQVFANTSMLTLLSRKPDISDDKPATLIVVDRYKKKTAVNVQSNCMLTMHPSTVFNAVSIADGINLDALDI